MKTKRLLTINCKQEVKFRCWVDENGVIIILSQLYHFKVNQFRKCQKVTTEKLHLYAYVLKLEKPPLNWERFLQYKYNKYVARETI